MLRQLTWLAEAMYFCKGTPQTTVQALLTIGSDNRPITDRRRSCRSDASF